MFPARHHGVAVSEDRQNFLSDATEVWVRCPLHGPTILFTPPGRREPQKKNHDHHDLKKNANFDKSDFVEITGDTEKSSHDTQKGLSGPSAGNEYINE